ncbi:MAG: hypothetical protein Q7J34_11110 [Bacteroidales bacterium]|nr:hypothetical protein [Bacteroidales bacterium]
MIKVSFKHLQIPAVCFMLTFYIVTLQAQNLFESDSALKITLSFSLDSLKKSDCNNPKTFKAQLSYYDGSHHNFNIKVNKRGKFRCDPQNCSFPPIKIDFKSKEVEKSVFNNQNKIKLVNPCRINSPRYQDYLIKEFLMYKILNLLTPYSLRVRIVDICILNPAKPNDSITFLGFLLEDADDMAKRNQGKILNASNVRAAEFDSIAMNMIDIFQYMIGNTDWSVTEPHNIIILSTSPFEPPFPVPYDFDWSGAVNAFYARPQPHLNLRSVTQRYYMGFCRNMNDIRKNLYKFNQLKTQIYSLIEDDQHLSSKGKRQLIKYFDDFFELIENQKRYESVFSHECLQ